MDKPIVPAPEIDQDRRNFLTFATAATGAVGVAFAAVPFIASWAPSERARAAGAPVEVDLTKLEPGQMVTYVYRKKPVYIVRRTPEMLAKLAGHESELKDAESKSSVQPDYAKNEARAARPEFLVVEGTCTHLGCLPKARFDAGASPELGNDWPGGFFCPCHGSKFDLSGRVFSGSPASSNLRVPAYSFRDDSTLVIGVDASTETA
ncbi:MAG: ubiquinol-cytochrome c reductase iron-sulfur subunit [Pseudomonadota bacterium]|nr:ubiquinol-cytochrome c reductase iron-sulfur subunit [Pseudomonadota bacterium]